MMKKIMLVAGCSHAVGSEIDGSMDSLYNRNHSYGAIVAKKFGYSMVNIAQNGMTNSGISRCVLKWFEKYYNPNTMIVFPLISWTESTRLELPTLRNYHYDLVNTYASWFDATSNKYVRITFGWDGGDSEEKEMIPYYHEFMAKNEKYLEIQTINLILQLQYFFKYHNLNYLMCNTMTLFSSKSKHLQDYMSLIDTTKYYKLFEPGSEFYTKYKNLGYNNSKAKFWHHSEEPHQLYAKELITFIEDNYEKNY